MDPASAIELYKVGGITLVFMVGFLGVTALFIKHLKEDRIKGDAQLERLITTLQENKSANAEHARTNIELNHTMEGVEDTLKDVKTKLDEFNRQSAVLLASRKDRT